MITTNKIQYHSNDNYLNQNPTEKGASNLPNLFGIISIGTSVLVGCSLMTTGRPEDLLDGVSIIAGGSALTTLFLGLYHIAKKDKAKGTKFLTAAVSLAALAGLSRGISKYLPPSAVTISSPKEGLSLMDRIYEKWFGVNKNMIDGLKQMNAPGPALGAMQGMAVLEPHTIVRAAWYEHFRFADTPQSYGFESLNATTSTQPPVLLLPGAVGTWPYLGDLARALKNAGIPVFVASVGAGGPTDEKLKIVNDKIDEIRAQYINPPTVDIVAHSMGANVGVATAYKSGSTFFDAEGNLGFRDGALPKADPRVGKVIALANPLTKGELAPLEQAKKIPSVFNILAKFDGIMGHKQPGLAGSHVDEVDAGHIGIVFKPQAHQLIIGRLKA